MRRTAGTAELDHLVVAAATLDIGIAYFAKLTGVTPQPGGKHFAMGTHNALLRLDARSYLEIIAIDPAGARPLRPRFFDLDDVVLRAEIDEKPKLIHWVARTPDIAREAAGCPIDTGRIVAMERGDFRWRITIPDDGRRPGAGIVPTLIQWEGAAHPAEALPDGGLALMQLAASHPEPAPIRAALSALGLDRVVQVSYDRTPRLAAMLRTPRGAVLL